MLEDLCDTAHEAVVWGIYEVSTMGRVDGKRQQAMLARARTQVDGLNDWLERQLAGRAWLNGEAFGWGDRAAYPPVHFAASLGYTPRAGSALEAWLEEMRRRPSAERLSAELTDWFVTPLNRPTDTRGTWKRLYKAHRLEWMVASGGLDVVAEGLRNDDIR